jgi:hypothetical protein
MRTALLLLALLAPAPVLARDSLGLFGDWGVFRSGSGCYAITDSRSAAQGRKAPATLSVARFARQDAPQVVLALGTTARSVRLTINGQGFTPQPQGDGAWMPDSRGDALLIEALARGNAAQVSFVSGRGNRLSDRFSLIGFSNALRAVQACR